MTARSHTRTRNKARRRDRIRMWKRITRAEKQKAS